MGFCYLQQKGYSFSEIQLWERERESDNCRINVLISNLGLKIKGIKQQLIRKQHVIMV